MIWIQIKHFKPYVFVKKLFFQVFDLSKIWTYFDCFGKSTKNPLDPMFCAGLSSEWPSVRGLALIAETCFFLLRMVVFTLFLQQCFYNMGKCWVLKIILLFRLQNRDVRVVFYLKGLWPIVGMFKNNNLLPIKIIQIFHSIKISSASRKFFK